MVSDGAEDEAAAFKAPAPTLSAAAPPFSSTMAAAEANKFNLEQDQTAGQFSIDPLGKPIAESQKGRPSMPQQQQQQYNNGAVVSHLYYLLPIHPNLLYDNFILTYILSIVQY